MINVGVDTILEAVRLNRNNVATYRSLGYIKVTEQGELLLFNYTEKATFKGTWNEVEKVSRGLIVHWPSATLVALPFEKFFNLNEIPATKLEALPTDKPFEITAKLDGSLGILYRKENKFAIATRGSFVSEQAIWATKYLNANYDFSGLSEDITLLFEIIYPENRVVLDYGKEEALYLIGARRMRDGHDFSYAELAELATRFNLLLVPSVVTEKLADLLPYVESSVGIEGWVVRFANGFRVKIKTAEYHRLQRIINGLSPSWVRDALLTGKEGWETFVSGVPEELYPDIDEMVAVINAQVELEERRLKEIFDNLLDNSVEFDRKVFALKVVNNLTTDRPYMFALLDGKDLRPMLLKNLDLNSLFNQNDSATVLADQL